MPIYDYGCQSCGHRFEALVLKRPPPACPECESEDIERELSLPRVQSSSTRAQAMRAARKRDAGRGRERVQEQLRYERNHDREG